MHHLRGSILLEVLIGVGIIGTGLLSVGKLQSTLISGNSLAKQRTEALVLSQKKIESLRGFTTLTASGSAQAFDNMASGQDTVSSENTTFTRTWTVTVGSGYNTLKVDTTWVSSTNESQAVHLETKISRTDPAISGLMMATTTPLTPSSSNSSSTSTSSSSGSSADSGSTASTSTSSSDSTSSSTTSSGSTSTTSTCSTSTRNAAIPSSAINNCDGTSSYTPTGSTVVLAYDNTTGAIVKVNGTTAMSIAGSLTIVNGSNGPAPAKTTSNVTITSAAENIYCFYTETSTSTATYTCYVASGWSGSIIISGSTAFNVCRSYATSPYSNVTSNLSTQNFSMIKSSKTCSTTTPATPTLHQVL